MTRVTIHQPEFAPWLGFFHKASLADVLILLDDVPFRKNYFQNRNRVRSGEETRWLTVPVEHGGLSAKIREVRIAWGPNPDWIQRIESTVLQAYRGAPHAQWMEEFLERVRAAGDLLVSANIPVLRWMLGKFSLAPKVLLSSSFGTAAAGSQKILELCRAAGATTYLSGVSGRDYLDLKSFQRAGIQVEFQEFHHPVYPQLGPGFIPQISALEALALMGPSAGRLLRADWAERLETVFT